MLWLSLDWQRKFFAFFSKVSLLFFLATTIQLPFNPLLSMTVFNALVEKRSRIRRSFEAFGHTG